MVRQRSIFWFIICCTLALCPGLGFAGPTAPPFTVERAKYVLPDVTLVNQRGERVSLKQTLLSNKTVLVDFIYTTCTTICPVLSANFTNFQKKLAGEADKFHLVSISIDPENDTPGAMKDYLERYGAQEGWDFLTGSRNDIDLVLRALQANTETKMDHYPLILIKSPAHNEWTRVYGLIGTSELIKIYQEAQ
jgi:protein SCO1/2